MRVMLKKSLARTALAVTILLSFTPHSRAISCYASNLPETKFQRLLMGEKIDNLQVLVDLENHYNRDKSAGPARRLNVPVVAMTSRQVAVENIGFTTDAPLVTAIATGPGNVRYWFKHPDNTDHTVPFFEADPSQFAMGYTSASRSIFFTKDGHYYSLRMPTDYPNGKSKEHQPEKVWNVPEQIDAIRKIQDNLNFVEQQFGTPPLIILAREIGIISPIAKKSEPRLDPKMGTLIRSLDFLRNKKRYYLPAFSLPYAGTLIAKKMHQRFSDFWEVHYAEVFGRVKAQMLIHYGFTMSRPHGQNFLIELDEHLMPTGRFVVRDLSDTDFYLPVFQVIAKMFPTERSRLMGNTRLKLGPEHEVHPNDINLQWERASERVISFAPDHRQINSPEILARWKAAHERGFLTEVARLLGISPKSIGDTVDDVDRLLHSGVGQQLVHDYLLRQRPRSTDNP